MVIIVDLLESISQMKVAKHHGDSIVIFHLQIVIFHISIVIFHISGEVMVEVGGRGREVRRHQLETQVVCKNRRCMHGGSYSPLGRRLILARCLRWASNRDPTAIKNRMVLHDHP